MFSNSKPQQYVDGWFHSERVTYLRGSIHNCKGFCIPMLHVRRTIRPLKHPNLCRKPPKICRPSAVQPQPFPEMKERKKNISFLCSFFSAYTTSGWHYARFVYRHPHYSDEHANEQSMLVPSGEINSIVVNFVNLVAARTKNLEPFSRLGIAQCRRNGQWCRWMQRCNWFWMKPALLQLWCRWILKLTLPRCLARCSQKM